MSTSDYTYLGPIIQIKEDAKLIFKLNVCSNNECANCSIKNNLREDDNFCNKCGSKVISKNQEKNMGKIRSFYNLCEIISGMEEFEDYLKTLELNNVLILTSSEIKKYGFFISSDELHMETLDGEFNIEEKKSDFIRDIENNGLKKLLDESFSKDSYSINYGLLTFGES